MKKEEIWNNGMAESSHLFCSALDGGKEVSVFDLCQERNKEALRRAGNDIKILSARIAFVRSASFILVDSS